MYIFSIMKADMCVSHMSSQALPLKDVCQYTAHTTAPLKVSIHFKARVCTACVCGGGQSMGW